MPVYVDDMRAKMGRLIMCHMVADTSAELMAMARTIHVSVRWLQHAGTHREHFDVCQAKRALAVAAGAKEITKWDLGLMVYRRKLEGAQ